MWGQPPSAVRGAKLRRSGKDFARVERALLPAAFDFDFDFDFDFRDQKSGPRPHAKSAPNKAACHPDGRWPTQARFWLEWGIPRPLPRLLTRFLGGRLSKSEIPPLPDSD